MTRIITGTLATCLLVVGGALAADAPPKGAKKGGDKTPDAIFKRLDADNDGKLSPDEFAKMGEVVRKNVDKAGKGGAKRDSRASKLFSRLDENHDGFLSPDEFK